MEDTHLWMWLSGVILGMGIGIGIGKTIRPEILDD